MIAVFYNALYFSINRLVAGEHSNEYNNIGQNTFANEDYPFVLSGRYAAFLVSSESNRSSASNLPHLKIMLSDRETHYDFVVVIEYF